MKVLPNINTLENEIYMEYKPKKKIHSSKMNTFFKQLNSTKRKLKFNYLQ